MQLSADTFDTLDSRTKQDQKTKFYCSLFQSFPKALRLLVTCWNTGVSVAKRSYEPLKTSKRKLLIFRKTLQQSRCMVHYPSRKMCDTANAKIVGITGSKPIEAVCVNNLDKTRTHSESSAAVQTLNHNHAYKSPSQAARGGGVGGSCRAEIVLPSTSEFVATWNKLYFLKS